MKKHLAKSGRLVPWLLPLALAAWVLARALRGRRYRFAGKSVLITGGSRGLGLVVARMLAAQGARLTVLAEDPYDLDRAEHDLVQRGAEVLAVMCDVTDREAVEAAVGSALARFGRIDVLINNAGTILAGPVEHMEVEDFREAMDVHGWGPLYAMLAVVPAMRRQGGGRIVNVSSIGGVVAVPHLAPYTMSKFALTGLSDAMRAELAKDNIQVITVIPGLVRTGSHVNAFFKGRHQAEFAWFSILNALPLLSTGVEPAARQILAGCRAGAPAVIITPQARVLMAANALFPGLVAAATRLANRLLPAPDLAAGDELHTGWESQSAWAPSILTWPADRVVSRTNSLRGQVPPQAPDRRSMKSMLKKEKTMADQITKSIIVDGDVSDVFALWADFQNFPRFMKYIKSVQRMGDLTSRWVMEGPLGKDVEWEAEITNLEPNRRIGWSTKGRNGDGDIKTSGQVSFRELGNRQTEVTVMMQYVPPAGAVGETVAKVFANPDKRVAEDLENFKKFAEGDIDRLTS